MTSAIRLPDGCPEFLRSQRFETGVTCPHCDSDDVTRKGRTGKGLQQYRCGGCETYFNDLTGTVFAGQRMELAEMFFIVRRMDDHTVADITEDLDRTYKTVLEFVHKVRNREDGLADAIKDQETVRRPSCDEPFG